MEVRVYDENLNLKGFIESPTSVLWTRRYQTAGEFQLYCPITPNNIALIQRGNIVTIQGKKEAGIIESLEKRENATENRMIVKGGFLETYMERRLIRPFYSCYNKKIELAMREILELVEPIPRVVLGELQGYEDTITFQATYKNLLKYETKLATQGGYGFRFNPDFTAKEIVFELYKGVDRTMSQSQNHRVIFSRGYNNIERATYTENDVNYKNVCYVGGRGEGEERVFVVAGDDTLTGLDRREMFLSATDILDDNITDEEYEEALLQRGYDELAKNNLALAFECETNADSNFKYGVDYDLGDIVTVKMEDWNIQVDERLTEVTEIYENGEMKVSPTFGSSLPTTLDWRDE